MIGEAEKDGPIHLGHWTAKWSPANKKKKASWLSINRKEYTYDWRKEKRFFCFFVCLCVVVVLAGLKPISNSVRGTVFCHIRAQLKIIKVNEDATNQGDKLKRPEWDAGTCENKHVAFTAKRCATASFQTESFWSLNCKIFISRGE